MTPLRLTSLLCGLALTAACVTTVRPVEVPGLEQFSTPCPDEPAVLSDEDVAALVTAMPTAEQREREFWAPNALSLRKCVAHERARADRLLSAGQRFNETVRNSR